MGPTEIPSRVTERVLARVAREGECVVSTYSLGSHGYTQVGWHEDGKRTMTLCHRVAWMAAHGSIADGMVVDHICRNRRCINVDHLQLITHAENCGQGGAVLATKTHCKRGHDMADAIVTPTQRRCRECRRQYIREWTRAKRAAELEVAA